MAMELGEAIQKVEGETALDKFFHKVKIAKEAGHYIVLTAEEGEAICNEIAGGGEAD